MPALIPVTPPFGNNAPPWYNNGIWGQLGCSVSQPGRYLQTGNESIWSFVDLAGSQLFSTIWRFNDRLLRAPLRRECAFAYYSLLIQGLKFLADMTVVDGASDQPAAKVRPSYQMFVAYPVPLYGKFGNVNPWLRFGVKKTFECLTEAMEHPDNVRTDGVTEGFLRVVSAPLIEMLVQLATSHFGYQRDDVLALPAAPATPPTMTSATAAIPGFAFRIPDVRWGRDPVQGYSPRRYMTLSQAESTLPPPGWCPNAYELEPLQGLALSAVLPLCQAWPEQQLFLNPGGVWAGQSGAPAAVAGSSLVDPTASPTVPTTEAAAVALAQQLQVGQFAPTPAQPATPAGAQPAATTTSPASSAPAGGGAPNTVMPTIAPSAASVTVPGAQ